MDVSDTQIAELVERVAHLLQAREATVATAESCTGGWIAKALTDRPGSSDWFGYGIVTYSNEAKETLLGLAPELIEMHGAVSSEVATQMAVGVRAISDADVSVAVSGVAGPDGGTDDKPVGTVWLAWKGPGSRAATQLAEFDGDRDSIRRQTVVAALNGILRQLSDG